MARKKKEQPKKDGLTKADIKRVCDILRRDDGVGAKDYIEQFSWLLFLRVFEGVESQLKDLEEAEGRKYKPVIDAEYQWSSWAKKDWKDKGELIHFINKKLFPYLKALKGTKEKDKIAELFRELHNKVYSPYNLLEVIEILDKIEKHHFKDTHLLSQVYEEILQAMGSEGGWSGEVYTPRPVVRLMIKIVNPKLGDTIFDPFVGSGGFLVESFKYLYENSAKDVRAWRTLQTKTFFGKEKKPLPFLIGNMNMILHHILVPNLVRTNTLDEDVHNVPEGEKYSVILTNPPFGGEEEKRIGENYPIKTSATEAMALQYVTRHLKNGGRCGIILPEQEVMFGGGIMARIRQELLEKCNVHSIVSLPKGVFTEMGAGVKTNLIFFDKTGSTKEIWYGEVKGKFTKKKNIRDEHLEDVFELWKRRKVSGNSWIVPIEKIKERDYDITPKNPKDGDSGISFSPDKILKEVEGNQHEIDKVASSLKEFLKNGVEYQQQKIVKLEEVLHYEQPTKYIVSSVDYDDSYATPVLTAGKSFILGYTNEKNGVFPTEKLPVIIFDDFTTAIKFVDFPFKVKSSAMKILHADKSKADIKFLFYAMQNITFPVRKHKRHWISEYSKIETPLPPLAEQKHIVDKLNKIFVEIEKGKEKTKQQLNYFDALKASVLGGEFKQEINATPVLAPTQSTPKVFDIQQAVALVLKRFERGEMVVAKVLYFAQKIYLVPLGIQFTAQNFGPYDSAVKKAVTAGLSPRNKFFAKKGLGNTQVLSLGTNAHLGSMLSARVNGKKYKIPNPKTG